MIRTQVSLEKKTYDEAKKEARRRGISFAELVRRALATMLRRENDESPYMRFSGALQSGDSEASRSVDEVVYMRERP